MPTSEKYLASIDELLLDPVTFEPAIIECVKGFASRKPWRGTLEERRQKF